jgi:hypothetical protein
MALFEDENLANQADQEDFKDDVLNNPADDDQPTVENNLAQNYDVAAQQTPGADPNPGGETLFQKIKDIVCSELDNLAGGDDGTTFDTILNAVETVMPGGILVKLLIKGVVSLILKLGVGAICPQAPAAPAAGNGN